MDSVACGDGCDLFDALRRDEASALGEGFEAAIESENHAFEQASVDYIGEWMTIQNAVKVRGEFHSAGDSPETAEEDLGARHVGVWGEVLGVASVADDGFGRDSTQEKGRGG